MQARLYGLKTLVLYELSF